MRFILFILVCLVVSACTPASQHLSDVNSDDGDKLTIGTVQKHIHIGMTQSNVASQLGAPNIVSNEGDGETWIYDKVSSVSAVSKSSTGLLPGLLLGFQSSSANKRSDKTLTVVIKFDKDNKVKDFSYHATSF